MDKSFLVRMHHTGTFAKADVDAWEINITTLEDFMLPADVATLGMFSPQRDPFSFVARSKAEEKSRLQRVGDFVDLSGFSGYRHVSSTKLDRILLARGPATVPVAVGSGGSVAG